MPEHAAKKANVGCLPPNVILAEHAFPFRFFGAADATPVGSGGSYAEQAGRGAVAIVNEARKLSDILQKLGEKSESDKAIIAKLSDESVVDKARLGELAAEVEELSRRNLEISGKFEALQAESVWDKAALEELRAAALEAPAKSAMEKLRADAEMARADAAAAAAKVFELKEKIEPLRRELRGWQKNALNGAGGGCQTQARLAEALVQIQTLTEAVAKKEASLGVAEEAAISLSTSVREMFAQIQAMSEALRIKELSLVRAEQAVAKVAMAPRCGNCVPQLPQLGEALGQIQTLMAMVRDKEDAMEVAKDAVREAFSRVTKVSEERDSAFRHVGKLAEQNKDLLEQVEQWDGPQQTHELRMDLLAAEKQLGRQHEQITDLGLWLQRVKKMCYDIRKTSLYQNLVQAFMAKAFDYKARALKAVKATLDAEGLHLSDANVVYITAVEQMAEACGYMHATVGLHKQRFLEMMENIDKTMALNVQLLERGGVLDAESRGVLKENDRLAIKSEQSEGANKELCTQMRILEAKNRELVKSLKNGDGNLRTSDGRLQKVVCTHKQQIVDLKSQNLAEKARSKEWRAKCTQQKEEADKAKKTQRSVENEKKDIVAKLEALQKQPNHVLEAALQKADTRVKELSAEVKKAQCANDTCTRLQDRIRLMGEKARDAEKREEFHKQERQALQRQMGALKEEAALAPVGLLGPAAFGQQREGEPQRDEAGPGQQQREVEALRDEVRVLGQQRELDAARIGALENGILAAQTNEQQANDILAEMLYAGAN